LAYAPSQYPSGESESVTRRATDPREEPAAMPQTDFDDDGLTAVAAPEWKEPVKPRHITGRPRKSNAAAPLVNVKSSRSRNMLIGIIVISLLIALACLAVFFFEPA
jgi:hypothetical protein